MAEKKKKKRWMQDVEIKNPGVCSGEKLGSKTCPKGSRRYALAKTFKAAAKGKKKKKK